MRLITKIKLQTNSEQKLLLKQTLDVCKKACVFVSSVVFLSSTKNKYDLQKLLYHEVKEDFNLSAQTTILCIQKVTNDYQSKHFTQRHYKKNSAMPFDDRILTINLNKNDVSIWTLNGRQKMSFACSKEQLELLKKRKGQSDLIIQNGEFFLLVGYEKEESKKIIPDDFLGVDLGIKQIAYDSDGKSYSGDLIEKNRQKYMKQRKDLQKKGTKNSKRKLCKIRKKEKNFRRSINHKIAKELVLKAKGTNFGIALEDLKGIRKKTTVRKKNRNKHSSWSFGQLRAFIEYKAKLNGVEVIFIDPKYTSTTCPKCTSINKKNRKSQEEFYCIKCNYHENADYVGSINIRQKARIIYEKEVIGSEKGHVSWPIAVPRNLCLSEAIGTATHAPFFRKE